MREIQIRPPATLVALFLLSLAGSIASCGKTRPDPPPVVIEKPVAYFVPIDPKLTLRCEWPREGKPSEAIEIARLRRECLEAYERQLRAIEQVEGGAAP